jgi:hypothetical protein
MSKIWEIVYPNTLAGPGILTQRLTDLVRRRLADEEDDHVFDIGRVMPADYLDRLGEIVDGMSIGATEHDDQTTKCNKVLLLQHRHI